MTRAWRAGILIAFFAALLGAPCAVLAAPPNQLSAATVSPTSGSTITMFTFGVRYTSSTEAAGAVTVSVAGVTLPMPRVSGSATDGTYRVSSLLPAGSWVPTFEAYPLKGPHPTITGPQIHVGALAPSSPSLLPSPSLVDADPAGPATAAPADDPATPTGVAEPQPTTPASASSPPDEAPGSSGEPAAATQGQVEPTAGPAKAAPGGGGAAPAAPVAPAPGTTASGSPDSAASPSSGTRRSPEPGQAAPPLIGSDSAWTALALGVFGVATLGILAIAWMLLGRRRRGGDNRPPLAAGAVPRGGTKERSGTPDTPTTEQLLGRAARRSRLDPSDDPIVAAMGLPQRADATPRYAAGQVSRGPGERPMTGVKRRRRP